MNRLWQTLLKAAPLRIWGLLAAGPIFTVAVGIMTVIVWKGDMAAQPPELAQRRLDFLGASLIIAWLQVSVIVITLAAVRVRGQGPAGMGFEVNARSDNEEPPEQENPLG